MRPAACVLWALIGCSDGAAGGAAPAELGPDVAWLDAAAPSDVGAPPDTADAELPLPSDATEPVDEGSPAELAEPADLSTPADAAEPPDLAEGPDLQEVEAAPTDTTESPDLSEPEDDTEAPAPCGDGVLDPGELCDLGPADPRCVSCTQLADATTSKTYTATRTIEQLPSANGGIALVVRTAPVRLERLYEHPYQAVDADTPTLDLAFDAYVGWRSGGDGGWLDGVKPIESGYEAGTGIVRVVQQVGALRYTTWVFAPFSHAERAAVMLVRVENTGDAAVEVSTHALWNLHLGGEGHSDGELAALEPGTKRVREWRGSRSVVYESFGDGEGYVTADNGGDPNNPFTLMLAHAGLADVVEGSAPGDIAVGLERRFGSVPAGEARWFGCAARLDRDFGAAPLQLGPQAWLQDEKAQWEQWHDAETPPASLSATELALYRGATAQLRMGQVTALDVCPSQRCAGQILASLPPGQWHITWVRDQAYAMLGLLRAGHLAEARAALDFLAGGLVRMDGAEPWYQSRYLESTDASAGVWGLGRPIDGALGLSLARYFGSGLEESDANAAGPNLEFDNLGLFLLAFAEVASSDPSAADAHWDFATERVADILVQLGTAPGPGGERVLLPDSSIWERHFCPHGQCEEPETRKRHAYSTIVGAAGLQRMSALAAARGDSARAQTYGQFAEALRAGVVSSLVHTPPGAQHPAVAGNVEELPYETYYLDGAAVEAVNLGVVPAGSRAAFGTVDALEEWLRVGPHSPGYKRNDDPTWYDRQEWVVVDLRTASALARLGQLGRARTLVDWVGQVAAANAGIFPELLSNGVYEPGSEDVGPTDPGGVAQGAWPMMGFGAGAYLLALHDLVSAE